MSDARVAGSAKAMAEQMRLEHSAAMREQVNRFIFYLRLSIIVTQFFTLYLAA